MRRIFIVFIFIFISISSAVAGEAFFRPLSRQQINISEGDSFKGVIELWNIQNISPDMISELKGKTFLDSFYVVTLEKPKWSENNPEVVIIEGTFILEKALKENIKTWSHGGLKIDVKIKEINTGEFKSYSKGFVVLDGEYKLETEDFKKYFIPLTFIGLILILFFFLRRRKKPQLRQRVEEVNWHQVFEKANNREDFSYLYENKKAWTKKLGERKLIYKDFLSASERYLFKREIQDFEMEEIKVAAAPILKELEG